MQLETPGGNHCCLLANDVQNWFIHLFPNIIVKVPYDCFYFPHKYKSSVSMNLHYLSHPDINNYHPALYINMINRNQLYTNQTSSRWKKVNKMRNFTVIADLNVAPQKSSMVTYLFSAYFISVYFSFTIVKKYGFVMGFVILAIYFRFKTIFKP